MDRYDVLRGLLFKRGWRTYAAGSAVLLVMAFASIGGDVDLPWPLLLAASLGSAVYAAFLKRRLR